MPWYHYIAIFFAGAFLGNTVPHFVQGVSGNKFPTPFSKPPGRGLSSATTNVLWGLFNLVVGFLLYTIAPINRAHPVNLIIFFAGLAILSLMGSNNFQHRQKE